jgi:glycosyltransferase involved in cell wall biosynthesis
MVGGATFQKLSDAECTVAITDWLYDQIRSEYPTLKPQQVIMARPGVDTEKWKPREALLERKGDTFRVVTVGCLHSSKGHDTLIKSIKLLVDEGRKINLRIIGSGSAKDSLMSLIEELEITDFLTLEGSLSEDQIISIMHESDIFVLASHAELLGVVYMESMSIGVPTIGTSAGGVPEIITHQEDGLLVPPKDEISLKEEIGHLMDDPKLRQMLSSNGRKKIVEQFDSRVGAKTVYERLCAGASHID